MSKPTIKKSKKVMLCWECTGDGVIAFGMVPMEAYVTWKAIVEGRYRCVAYAEEQLNSALS